MTGIGLTSVAMAATYQVQVTVENLAPANSVAISPLTVAVHDGTFDAFNAASAATTGIQNVAELGDGSALPLVATRRRRRR